MSNSEKARKHKDEGTRQLAKGRLKEALEEFIQVQKLEPQDLANRQKVGDLHGKLGDKVKAIESYQAVAGAYAADGLLLKAIAVCKLILQMDANHTETQRTLADLYGKKRGDSSSAELPAAMSAAIGKPVAPGQKMSASMIRGVPAGQLPHKPAEDGPKSSAIITPPPPMVTGVAVGAVKLTQVAVPAPEQHRVVTGMPVQAEPAPRVVTGMPLHMDAPPRVVTGMPIQADAPPRVVTGTALPGNLPPRISPHSAMPDDADSISFELEPGGPVTGAPPPLVQARPVSQPPLVTGTVVAPPAAGQAASWGAPAPVEPAGPPSLEDFEMPSAEGIEVEVETGSASAESDFGDLSFDDTSTHRVDLDKLPPIPLFSDLSKNAFIDLMERMDIRVMSAGDTLISEGEQGNSFFIIASGTVRIEKVIGGATKELAKLSDGAFFGEMALLSDAPRTASVVAETDGELFEISRETLNAVIADFPSVQQVMLRFYKQRLLANLLNMSPIFAPFDKEQRKALIEMFRSREVAPGEAVLTEGQKGDGLYMVLSGKCSVQKTAATGVVELAQLKEGQVFGEMSLLTRAPVGASIVAINKTIVLRLPRKQFNEVIMTHPQVLEMVSELSANRQKQNDQLVSSGGTMF